jgi:large subunit ribosomal protein L21
MYAVIKTGGKQYKVAEGDVVRVEKLALDAGQAVAFDEVLMLDDGGSTQVGSPNVAGASVKATVLEQARAKKIIVFKKRRRKNSRTKNGHRQDITVVRVTEIVGEFSEKKALSKKAGAPKQKETEASAATPPADAKLKKAAGEQKSPPKE